MTLPGTGRYVSLPAIFSLIFAFASLCLVTEPEAPRFAFVYLVALLMGVLAIVVGFLAITERPHGAVRIIGKRAAVVGIILALVILPETVFLIGRGSFETRRRMRLPTVNNLKAIGLAMHHYEYVNGSLPSPAICNRQGEPLLSWRVLLLPYLDEQELFSQFHLDEPWDSVHNLAQLEKMPKVYLLPYKPPGAEPYTTNYLAVVGEGAAFQMGRAFHLPAHAGPSPEGDFPDGLANTILVAETPVAVPWTKPEDLPYGRDKPLPTMGGHYHGFYVLLGDGSVRFVSENISETTLRAAITRNGGEVLGPDW